MSKTRRDLNIRALQKLGVLAAGQAASDEDVDAVDGYVDGLVERLATLELVYIGDVEAIEDQVFDPVATLLANEAKDEFGVPAGQFDTSKAEWTLRRISRSAPTGEPMKATYY